MQTAPRRLHLKGKNPHRVWWRKPRASIPRNTAQPWLITQMFRIEVWFFLRTDSPFARYVITATRFPMLPSVVLDSVSACARCVFLTFLNPVSCCCVLTASYSASCPVCQRVSDHLQWPRIPKLMLQITRHIALGFVLVFFFSRVFPLQARRVFSLPLRLACYVFLLLYAVIIAPPTPTVFPQGCFSISYWASLILQSVAE